MTDEVRGQRTCPERSEPSEVRGRGARWPLRNAMLGGSAALAAVIGALSVHDARLQAASQGQTVQAPMFEVDPLWPKPLPNRWILGSAVGVAIDSRDHIYLLNLNNTFAARTEIGAATDPRTGECCVPAPSVLEFDAAGTLLSHWSSTPQGNDWPVRPSGLAIDSEGNLWIGGSGGLDTRIFKFTRAGQPVTQIGKIVPAPAPPAAAQPDTAGRVGGGGGRGGRGGRGAPAPTLPATNGSMEAFGGAVRVTLDSKSGEAFVADGARNGRVAVVDIKTGAITRVWGAYGNKPDDVPATPYNPDAPPAKHFSSVTCAAPTSDGQIYVCDRGNNRIQVFKKDGSFVKEKAIAPRTLGAGAVWDIAFSRDPQQKYLYVADGQNMKVHILDRQSLEVLTSFGDGGRYPGQFLAVHSIATDSRGNIYTTETFEGKRVQKFIYKGIGSVSRNQGVLRPKQ